ncbi:MAG: hypothetical protein Q9181_003623 [Wetmoreana brouardii]
MTHTITLGPLNRADGSASYSSNGYSVLAAVNGPVEVQRRDEIPEEAAIDVVLRPAVGVGAVRERHLESIIEKTLRQVIIVSAHPRTLIQLTLQIVATPVGHGPCTDLHQSASVSSVVQSSDPADSVPQNLPLLPALLQSSILALLSTSLPLHMTLTSTLVAVSRNGELVGEPSVEEIQEATSLHVLSFSSHGELMVTESEGAFDIETWEQVYDKAEHGCRGSSMRDSNQMDDVDMETSEADNLQNLLRGAIKEKSAREQRWREG